MADKNYIYEEVEAYLNGELSGSELANFETQLRADTTLQHQLKVAKAAQKLLIQHRLLQIKTLANEEFERIDNKGNNFNKYIIGGSLGVAVIISGLFFFSDSNERTSTKTKKQPLIVVEPKKVHTVKESTQPTIEPTPEKTVKKLSKNEPKKLIKDTIKTISIHPSEPVLTQKPSTNNAPTLPVVETEIFPTEKINPCDQQQIKAIIHTTNGCFGENKNSIEVGKITGVKPPASSEIINNQNEPVNSNIELPDGNYTVVVSGSNGCKKEYPITLKSKNCPINIDFNPSLGETWEIPLSTSTGVLIIYTKTGKEIIQKTLPANEVTNWNGLNRNNEIQIGYFIFTITYEDGSYLKGEITVTR